MTISYILKKYGLDDFSITQFLMNYVRAESSQIATRMQKSNKKKKENALLKNKPKFIFVIPAQEDSDFVKRSIAIEDLEFSVVAGNQTRSLSKNIEIQKFKND